MTKAMAEFVKWAMQEGPWEGGDLDGGSVQDKAEELGLIVRDTSKEEVWFVLAPEVIAALKVS